MGVVVEGSHRSPLDAAVPLEHAPISRATRTRWNRTLRIDGDVDAAQKVPMADIAARTPVTLTLKAGVPIGTTLS